MENLGRRSICQSCKKPIYHNGRHWSHVEGSPRHPAKPLSTDELEMEIAALEYKIATKKHLLGLLRRGGAMTETKFTQGPWVVEFDEDGGYDAFYAGYHILAPDWSRDICTVEVSPWRFRYNPTWEEAHAENERAAADAHLIASSPDMYKALKAMVDMVDFAVEAGVNGSISNNCITTENARIALAKARGEQ